MHHTNPGYRLDAQDGSDIKFVFAMLMQSLKGQYRHDQQGMELEF